VPRRLLAWAAVADWTTISSLATAGGTLVLAVATFSSVRSANRSARTAERALQAGLRPVLMPSRLQDPPEKLRWREGRWTTVEGGRASVEIDDGNVFFAMSLRNVGAGIAVIQAWHTSAGEVTGDRTLPELESFRSQQRDLYIPPGDKSFWQGRVTSEDDDAYRAATDAVMGREPITVHLLYTDHEGGQRTVSRFLLTPVGDDQWLLSVVLHWNLDRDGLR
jgi:hypothetical protein